MFTDARLVNRLASLPGRWETDVELSQCEWFITAEISSDFFLPPPFPPQQWAGEAMPARCVAAPCSFSLDKLHQQPYAFCLCLCIPISADKGAVPAQNVMCPPVPQALSPSSGSLSLCQTPGKEEAQLLLMPHEEKK